MNSVRGGMMDNERWKPFPDPRVEEDYEISSHGNVRKKGGLCIKQVSRSKTGDSRVFLMLDKRADGGRTAPTSFLVHRLVATAFIKNPKGLPFVVYKDKNKDNLLSSNLSWVTTKEASKLKAEERLLRGTVQELYLMVNSLGVHKIGISLNPEDRANTIKLNSGFETRVLQQYCTPDAPLLEQLLHDHYKDQRLEGEWFKDIDSYEFKVRVTDLITLAPMVRDLATVQKAINETRQALATLKGEVGLCQATFEQRCRVLEELDGVLTSPKHGRASSSGKDIRVSLIYRSNNIKIENDLEVMKRDCAKLRKDLVWLLNRELALSSSHCSISDQSTLQISKIF